jgi:hypothetical protein
VVPSPSTVSRIPLFIELDDQRSTVAARLAPVDTAGAAAGDDIDLFRVAYRTMKHLQQVYE